MQQQRKRKLTVLAKPGAQNYVVTDTLSEGLTPPVAAEVAVSAGAGNYAVDVTGQVITVTFEQDYLDTITADTTITIEYTATLNGNAVVATGSNDNTAKLTWGHNNDSNYTEDEAKVWTAEVQVNKETGEGEPLEGAGFVVKNSENKYYKVDAEGNVTWVDDIEAATMYETGKDGKLSSKFEGLTVGSYTLVEKQVPAGYNKLDDVTFTITNGDYSAGNLSQEKTVVNNAGTTMPETGGMGTTILYIVGAALVLGAGAVLVTRRKADR